MSSGGSVSSRRSILLLPLALAGCGLATRPYVARTDWPLDIPPPATARPRRGAPVLLVRDLGAGPGLDQRGFQVIEKDGSLRVSFYQQWAVPPPEGATAALRRWLGASGLFSAVIGPGSVLLPNYVLEGDINALAADSVTGRAEARVAFRLIASRGGAARLVFDAVERGTAPLSALDGATISAAERQALAEVFTRLTARIAAALR